MSSYRQYTVRQCEYRHDTYSEVLELRSGGRLIDKRIDGPTYWEATCEAHMQWRANATR